MSDAVELQAEVPARPVKIGQGDGIRTRRVRVTGGEPFDKLRHTPYSLDSFVVATT